jgi:hypothetical protein
MHILIEGKVYSSEDVPVMILFSKNELEQFKNESSNADIHCSFPNSWGQQRGNDWMKKNTGKISKRREEDDAKKPSMAEIGDENLSRLQYKLRYYFRNFMHLVGVCPECRSRVNYARGGYTVCPSCGAR